MIIVVGESSVIFDLEYSELLTPHWVVALPGDRRLVIQSNLL